ncbi:MAG: hypothetical protein Q7S08_03605 [bacterium]|nr:hypothetical protein [bacterium]
MKKLIKIFFNISYVVSLSALVFLGSVISKVIGKGSHNEGGRTILGSGLSLNIASADLPAADVGGGGEGYSGDSGSCEGGDSGSSDSC